MQYKMASMLVPRKGSSAYACQCSWIAVNDFVQIRIGKFPYPQRIFVHVF